MRDAGLQQAIAMAGGVSELARRLGVAPPSVSTWTRVPAERVLAVEAATGVGRGALRPDLYPDEQVSDPLEAERAEAWKLLGALLREAPDAARLGRLGRLQPSGAEPFAQALAGLGSAARQADAAVVEREYLALFIGLGRGELQPYASWYLTGFLNDRPLAKLRIELRRLGIEADASVPEPEDHVGRLGELMGGLIQGPFAVPLEVQRAFFEAHLAPWVARFFDDLGKAESARFYQAVARMGSVLVALETQAFSLAA